MALCAAVYGKRGNTVRLKKGVSVTGIRSEVIFGLMVSNSVYEKNGAECVITSVVDGTHSKTSLHYAGCAADLRTRNIPQHLQIKVRDEIKEALGVDYDVVLEKDHIHFEWQPRRRNG